MTEFIIRVDRIDEFRTRLTIFNRDGCHRSSREFGGIDAMNELLGFLAGYVLCADDLPGDESKRLAAYEQRLSAPDNESEEA